MRTVAIIQARLGSRRLPGKVLLPIAGVPMVRRVFDRACQIDSVDAVVVACPAGDAAIIAKTGVPTWSDPDIQEADVLGRYAGAALHFAADRVVRITGDCPLLDPTVGSGLLAKISPDQIYAGVVSIDGGEIEILRALALVARARAVTTAENREHVTSYWRSHTLDWGWGWQSEEEYALTRQHWSVDTYEDLEAVRRIYEAIGTDQFGWRDVIAVRTSQLCEHCARGAPFHANAESSIGGPRTRICWDLHAVEDTSGVGLRECTAWPLPKRKAAGIA